MNNSSIPTVSTTTTSSSLVTSNNRDFSLPQNDEDERPSKAPKLENQPREQKEPNSWRIDPSTGSSTGGYPIKFWSSRPIDVLVLYFGSSSLNTTPLDEHTVKFECPAQQGPEIVPVVFLTKDYTPMPTSFTYVNETISQLIVCENGKHELCNC
jgi:hypothetical protein